LVSDGLRARHALGAFAATTADWEIPNREIPLSRCHDVPFDFNAKSFSGATRLIQLLTGDHGAK